MKKYRTHSGGFTLMELMVVILIMGLLAAVIMAAVQQSRAQGRDASRVQAMKELQKGIELYYSEYGYYPVLPDTTAARSRDVPPVDSCIDGTTGPARWCALISAISPYYKGGIDDPLDTGNHRYWYDADGAQPQRYGLMTIFETSKYDSLTNGDGGYYCQSASPGCTTSGVRGYELGEAPRVCGASNWTNEAC